MSDPSLASSGTCNLSLEAYLEKHGFDLTPPHSQKNEGYITDKQKEQFSETLKSYPPITSVLEIGFNAGHSAEHILSSCPGIKHFVSFDLNCFQYTACALEYFHKKYPDIFYFIEGDSMMTIPQFYGQYPHNKFDLIYIDGGHSYKCCTSDILNCAKLSHSNTMLWIDDYQYPDLNKAILSTQIEGIIEVIAYHESDDDYGKRYWAEARYCL